MKGLFYKFIEFVAKKLNRMCFERKARSITGILTTIVNGFQGRDLFARLSVKHDNHLTKLNYDIELTTCKFTQSIELNGGVLTFKTLDMEIFTYTDTKSYIEEFNNFFDALEKEKGLIELHFIALKNQ